MTKCSINSIETFGLVDGPGIRTVIFLNGCMLRCKYCHNPETWKVGPLDTTKEEIIKKILRNKPYYKNKGGVTFSGGEPLLHRDFLIEICSELKKVNIHIDLDTSGVGIGKYEEILSNIDLVLLDIKHTEESKYKDLTGHTMDEHKKFIEILNKTNKKVWIRQVIVPNITDSEEYLISLNKYLKKINNIERIDFLPYHKLGIEKYHKLNIVYPLEKTSEMDILKCRELYNHFINDIYK